MRFVAAILLFASAAFAQIPRIGIIDVYGTRKVPLAQLRKALGAGIGDRLPASKGAVEERIETVPGVVAARLEAACCDDENRTILYVGVEETGAARFPYREPPEAEAVLPEELISEYRAFVRSLESAGRSGRTAEDLSQGHSLMADPLTRTHQVRLAELAPPQREILQNVLRHAASEEQRAIAAYVIGYVKDKARVVDDLQFALQDPDDTVRNNAMRSLAGFAVLASKDPEAGLKISPTWLIELLNSLIWTDRNNAAVALVTISEGRDRKLLEQLRASALPSLVEMARWQHLPHALPGYILLGRALGVAEEQLQEAWSKGERETIIKGASADKK